jgi:formate dehydrogenase major subunit
MTLVSPTATRSAVRSIPSGKAISANTAPRATNCPEYKVTAVQVRLSTQKSEWQRSYDALREATRKVAATAAE